MEQRKPKEPRGDEGSVMVFHVNHRKLVRENYKETYELWRERNPMTRIHIGTILLLNR
jgi:hypothetical protein